MTPQEILEGNILVAEFMGGKYDKDTTFPIYKDDIWLPIHGICNYTIIGVGKGKILRYHESWDWLMPVVMDIRKKNFRVEMDANPMQSDSCYIFSAGAEVVSALSGHLLTATYKAIIKFITWYNTKKI